MTGVGLAAGPSECGDLRLEVRAVNGRTLSLKLRLGAGLAAYETAVEDVVRRAVQRGSLTVIVERQQAAVTLPDRGAMRIVAEELQALARELGLPPPDLALVVQAAGASGRGEPATSRPLPPRFQALLESALADLTRHRAAEGEATARAFAAQLDEFEAHVATAAARAPELVAAFRDRLLQRVQEFVREHVPGPVPALDLVREVAVHADRVDTAEELQRLHAHIGEVRAVLARGGEVGRRLEFLLQELLRETNTLGAKSPDVAMAHVAVAMKSAIDRMKEQVANLE
jgi:uncharacterized protein (TIGR00255 family)